ncbi:hypothetical protein LB506_009217 [Fusarium annulatum]|nr:hypothetical protein LB506_009217 [Fusarium annulatum]
MGLFASDNYWHTDWDQYLHSETFLEDVPPLAVSIMEAIGIAASVLSFGTFSSKLMNSVQCLRGRMEIEHEDYLRSLRGLQNIAEHTHTQISGMRETVSTGLTEKIDRATIHPMEEISVREKPLERAHHNTSSSMSTTWGNDAYFKAVKSLVQQSKPEIRRPTHCTVPVDVPNKFEEANADPPATPFYDFGNSARSIFDEAEVIKSGGTSRVFRVRIHQSYVLDHGGEGKRHIVFAVKKVYSQNSQDYARERDAYRRMSLTQTLHSHIVPLFATYRMEGQYHFVFPSANCDLAMYWRNEPRPSNDKRTLQWFEGQMRGLSDALSTVHGQNCQERKVYGVHGDIKPENILCFSFNDRWPVLALTDFGSSYFLTPEDKDVPKGLKHTPVYRAPEVDTSADGITQAYDVWSLGCVFAEAIAWFYDGKAGIANLIKARLDHEKQSPNRDAFFYLKFKFNKKSGLSAKLKPEVQRLLISFRGKSRSSPVMDDILSIVLEGMLQVNMSKRMSARDIHNALTQMCMKLGSDPDYFEPRGTSVLEMDFYYTTPYIAARSISLTTSRFQVHTNQNASRRRLDRTVDASYYTNTTTQSLRDTQITLKPRFACPYHKAGNTSSAAIYRRSIEVNTSADAATPHSKQTSSSWLTSIKRLHAIRGGQKQFMRKSSKESEEDRWFDIYRIAFPSFNQMLDNITPYHESNTTSLSTLNSTSSNGISQYKDYLRNRGVEEYAAKLAKMGVNVTLEAAAKLLELQVKDLESFDETMREPVRAYGFETEDNREKTSVGEGAPPGIFGSSDSFGPMQLLARYADDKAH